MSQVDSLTRGKKVLEDKVAGLQLTVELLRQSIRCKTVEINNVPEQPGEKHLLNKIGLALDVDVSDVDTVFRARPAPSTFDPKRPPPIIATFLKQSTRDALVFKKKVKRDLSTTHIGWSYQESFPIYINESLTPYFKNLYGMARTAKRACSVKYVWVKGGRVLVLKTDGCSVVSINAPEVIPK